MENLMSFTRTTFMPCVSTICLLSTSRASKSSVGCRYEKRISVADVLRCTPVSSIRSTHLRQLIINGVLPGPRNASDVTCGKTSPVAMPKSFTTPSFSPSTSKTGNLSISLR